MRTAAEIRLIDAAAKGDTADCRTREASGNDVANGREWPHERAISGRVIRALAAGSNPDWRVSSAGIRIAGARIADELDLSGIQMGFALALVDCYIERPLILAQAAAQAIVLGGSRIVGMEADGLRVRSEMFLNEGFQSSGRVSLGGAQVGGDLSCIG